MSFEVILAVLSVIGIPILAWGGNRAKDQLQAFIDERMAGVRAGQETTDRKLDIVNARLESVALDAERANRDNKLQDRMIYWLLGQAGQNPTDFEGK